MTIIGALLELYRSGCRHPSVEVAIKPEFQGLPARVTIHIRAYRGKTVDEMRTEMSLASLSEGAGNFVFDREFDIQLQRLLRAVGP